MPKKPKSEVRSQKSEVVELTEALQRVHADFQNYKRRSDEARAGFMNIARQEVIGELLPLLDDIDRALAHTPEELKDNAWARGVGQIAKRADETLRRLGIEKVESLGQPFDPYLHEAVGGEGEIVVEELQPGYRLGEKVIRHAIVKVGRK